MFNFLSSIGYRNKKNLVFVGFVLLAVSGGLLGFFTFRNDSVLNESSTEIVQLPVLPVDAHIRGDVEKAKVVIVQFSDYGCPACGAMYRLVRSLQEEYGDDIAYAYRHAPDPRSTQSQKASEAAEVAGSQGKFWEMTDLLFEKREEWISAQRPAEFFAIYAQSLGIDGERLALSVRGGDYEAQVKEDYQDALTYGGNVTPSLFINGVRYNGILDIGPLKVAIDKELKK